MTQKRKYFLHNLYTVMAEIWSRLLPQLNQKVPLFSLNIGSKTDFVDDLLLHEQSRMTFVDPFSDNSVLDTFRKKMTPYSKQIKVLQGTPTDALRILHDHSFDFISFDSGDSTGATVVTDAILAFMVLRSNGIMLFHNYLLGDFLRFPSRKNAIDTFLTIFRSEYHLVCFIGNYVGIQKNIKATDPLLHPHNPEPPTVEGTSTYTNNWFGAAKPTWEKYLQEFKGKPVNALEIGSYEGRSASWLLDNILTHTDSHLTCIDPFLYDGTFDRFCRNMNKYGKRITLYQAFSENALRRLSDQSFDFIYVDGAHTAKNVLMDAVLSFLLLAPGGIMLFDDYTFGDLYSDTSVKTGIDAFLSLFRNQYSLVCWSVDFGVWNQVGIRKN